MKGEREKKKEGETERDREIIHKNMNKMLVCRVQQQKKTNGINSPLQYAQNQNFRFTYNLLKSEMCVKWKSTCYIENETVFFCNILGEQAPSLFLSLTWNFTFQISIIHVGYFFSVFFR